MDNKANHQQNEISPTKWEKIFTNDMTTKGLISNIYKYFTQLTIRKQFLKKDLNRHFFETKNADGP